MFRFTSCLVLFALINSSLTDIFYTNPNKEVSDTRDGSWARPFSSINECVKALKNPGDECQIREGSYRENVQISGLNGTEKSPIVIQGFGDERPTLDGTVEIAPVFGKWEQNGDVFFGKIDQTIWQLFFDDLLMTNARWPNANWSKKTVFDGRNHWARTSTASKRGMIITRDNSLADSGLDMTGAMAVLNIGSWNTFVATVDSHVAGENSFNYTDTFGNIMFNTRKGRYYIEDKLNLLDAPEEWFFDKDTNILYFIPPEGKDFTESTTLRGKIQTYALTIKDSLHVVLKNLDFFGTTLQGLSSLQTKTFIDQIKFDSLNFLHPCASKRMLQDVSVTNCTIVNGRQTLRRADSTWSSFIFFNNTFHGADGIPLTYYGAGVTLDNNLFEYNDWTSANSLTKDGGHSTIRAVSLHDTYIRNTLRYNGEGHGIRPGYLANVTLNRVIGQCWGMQQNDGAGIHVTIGQQKDIQIDRNWVHGSPKYGIRFDGTPPRVGVKGSISRNVAVGLGSGGVQAKGDYHSVVNNLAFDDLEGNARAFPGCSVCVWKYVRANTVEINAHSTVVGNLADAANGGVMFKNGKRVKPTQVYPLNGEVVKDNTVNIHIKDMLHDADNYDFRPLDDSATVGPYKPTDLAHYWIPGRQLYKASSPVPPHDSDHVIAPHRDTLMWLNAYGCDTHHVYFGTSKSGVSSAVRTSEEFVQSAYGGVNIVKIRGVGGGVTYFWRVDAVCGDTPVKGDIWEFTTRN